MSGVYDRVIADTTSVDTDLENYIRPIEFCQPFDSVDTVRTEYDGRHDEETFWCEGLEFKAGDSRDNILKVRLLVSTSRQTHQIDLVHLMFEATQKGHYYITRYLIDHNLVDINSTDTPRNNVRENRRTVVVYAHTFKFIKWLIDHGSIVTKHTVRFGCCCRTEMSDLLYSTFKEHRARWCLQVIDILNRKRVGPELIEYILSDHDSLENFWSKETCTRDNGLYSYLT